MNKRIKMWHMWSNLFSFSLFIHLFNYLINLFTLLLNIYLVNAWLMKI